MAGRALDLGAQMVNDVSGLTYDTALGEVVGRRRAAVVLMHNRGRSAEMYQLASYADITADVATELGQAVDRARAAGTPDDRVILDPGLGFAKRAAQSFELLAHLPSLERLGRPLLLGASRKSFLRAALGDVPSEQRLWGTAAAVTASVLLGAHIVRVHDVAEMVQVLELRMPSPVRIPGSGVPGFALRFSRIARTPEPEPGTWNLGTWNLRGLVLFDTLSIQ